MIEHMAESREYLSKSTAELNDPDLNTLTGGARKREEGEVSSSSCHLLLDTIELLLA